MRVYSSLLIFWLISASIDNPLFAQSAATYHSKPVYDKLSTDLMKKLKSHLESEFENEKFSLAIWKINHARSRYIKELVKQETFIYDPHFETYLEGIINRIVEANQLEKRTRTILLMRTPQVNATNYGRGIFFVTLGMLSSVKSEDELALALAHEIAHDELDHIRQNIRRRAMAEKKDHVSESLSRVLSGNEDDEQTIEMLRKTISDASQFSKKAEFEADSLGARFLTRAGYDPHEGETLFKILKKPTALKHDIGIEYLLALHSEAYPLQDEWFNDRTNMLDREPMVFGLMLDSLGSHPDIDMRLQKFKNYRYEYPGEYRQGEIAFKDVNHDAEVELVEVCYKTKMYDRSMFYALQILHRDATNAYLVSRIAKMLLDLRTWKEGGTTYTLTSRMQSKDSDELKLLRNMLLNVSKNEASELGYRFIADRKRFNTAEPSHYFLLWKFCLATNRTDEASDIKKRYKENFGMSIDHYDYK